MTRHDLAWENCYPTAVSGRDDVFDIRAAAKHAVSMSAREIIEELPKLKPDEFRLVKAKVDDLARAQRRTIGDALLDLAGTAEGLPRDMARNHDHYLHGTPRRES